MRIAPTYHCATWLSSVLGFAQEPSAPSGCYQIDGVVFFNRVEKGGMQRRGDLRICMSGERIQATRCRIPWSISRRALAPAGACNIVCMDVFSTCCCVQISVIFQAAHFAAGRPDDFRHLPLPAARFAEMSNMARALALPRLLLPGGGGTSAAASNAVDDTLSAARAPKTRGGGTARCGARAGILEAGLRPRSWGWIGHVFRQRSRLLHGGALCGGAAYSG